MAFRIGDLAKRAQTSAAAIRYYEEIGLLPHADRRAGGQRTYDEADLRRLTFIRSCRDFGFAIPQVRALSDVMQDPSRSCREARDMAMTHLTGVRQRLVALKALEQSLARYVETCNSRCCGGPAPDCTIFDDLALARGP